MEYTNLKKLLNLENAMLNWDGGVHEIYLRICSSQKQESLMDEDVKLLLFDLKVYFGSLSGLMQNKSL